VITTGGNRIKDSSCQHWRKKLSTYVLHPPASSLNDSGPFQALKMNVSLYVCIYMYLFWNITKQTFYRK